METKFDQCIRTVRNQFQIIQQDIFHTSRGLLSGFFVMLAFNFITAYGCCYSIFYTDAETAFKTGVILTGVTQVGIPDV